MTALPFSTCYTCLSTRPGLTLKDRAEKNEEKTGRNADFPTKTICDIPGYWVHECQ